ncbi:SpoIIE family protein phosphatase [Spongiactinospora sp. TRM90649]|uniref:SpoIIE family protein phosphatase n=1 Tax=Spongiactinospora sp. TRM90649 TaxID=3031114 RepID=UPI0023F6E0EB|nr:SpoIIE family protein phosphatase [Spongiactinospora sp. TRM90649]MDF5755867.1 SpoIIE family protein phosphatase [Spongiactinospora sp. TRM90649]
MTEQGALTSLEHALTDLATRVTSLREARSTYPKDLDTTLDAALAELDTAAELLATAVGELRKKPRRGGERDGGALREQKLMRQIFRSFPIPVVVMDNAGIVRRINSETSRMLGSPAGYLIGRPFPLLVDVARRAAFRSHLSAVLQSGQPASFQTRLAHQGRAHTVQLALTRLVLPGEPQDMMVAVALPTDVQLPERPAGRVEMSDAALLMASARRKELLARMTRLLLDDESLREPVALSRAARLLAAESADWVIIDVVRDGVPVRATVLGPAERPVGEPLRLAERMAPASAPVVAQVLTQGSGVVQEMVEDENLLGLTPDGTPLLRALGAGSLMCVPIQTGQAAEGAVTLLRLGEHEPFTLADLGLMEEIGTHLGLALRAQRAFQSRSAAAAALQTSVVPKSLPDIPGFEAAAIYHSGSGPVTVGAEFYDVFPISGGWGISLGGACGKGETAAAVSAMVRNGLRVLGAFESDPAKAIRKVNQALLMQGSGMFVMALTGYVHERDRGRRIRLASAGHHPAAVLRPDGGVRFLAGGGVPLGIDDAAEMGAEEVELTSGETLVFYSDGLVASRDEHGEPYGEGRLSDVLGRCVAQPPATLVKSVEEDRSAFSGGRFYDEIVILALRVT